MNMNVIRVREFASQLDAWKVLPAPAADVLKLLDALDAVRVDDQTAALRQRVATGTIKPTELAKAVIEAAVAPAVDRVGALVDEMGYPAASRFAGIISEHADSIVVDGLRPHFDRAVADLTAAVAVLPAGASAEDVLALGADVAAAWHSVANAAGRLTWIAEVRTTLTRHYGYGDDAIRELCSFIAGPLTEDELSSANRLYLEKEGVIVTHKTVMERQPARGGGWEQLLRGGYTLHLNTATEASNVVTRTPDPAIAA